MLVTQQAQFKDRPVLKIQISNLQAAKSGLDQVLKQEVALLGREVYNEVRNNTPVDTGRAQQGWRLKTRDRGFEITNPVPYVPVLDKGRHMTPRGVRGSLQAPKGIIGPSLDNIKGKN